MKRFDPAAMRVLDDNHAGAPGTFTHDLHQRNTFSRTRLKTLIEAVDRIAEQRARGLALDSVTATKLFDLYDGSKCANSDPRTTSPGEPGTGTMISTPFTTPSGTACRGR